MEVKYVKNGKIVFGKFWVLIGWDWLNIYFLVEFVWKIKMVFLKGKNMMRIYIFCRFKVVFVKCII